MSEQAQAGLPNLKRVLGRWDLVLLFVVAVFNLNVVTSIAANGGVTLWLLIISILLFFWHQGIAVIELSHRYPSEGVIYLCAKDQFGVFDGFRNLVRLQVTVEFLWRDLFRIGRP